MPEAALVGKARLKVLLFPVYDASLYAPEGDYRKSGPLALELDYLFDVEKERIVNQTVKTFERRKLGSEADIANWRKIMDVHFSDVQKGRQDYDCISRPANSGFLNEWRQAYICVG